MVPDVQRWVTEYLKDGAGCWDFQKWGDLKEEFKITFILPYNNTLSVDTLEEMQRYTNVAMVCISFLESAEVLEANLSMTKTLCEKEWLYNLIISEIRECIGFLNNNYERSFPGITNKACSVLSIPFRYAKNGLFVIENGVHITHTKH